MTLYGLYIRDLSAGDFVWFTTVKSLEPGAYRLGQNDAGSPDVYVAESIPALVLQVGRLLDEAEALAQSFLSPSGTPANVERRIATEMTEGLVRRLSQNSIWVSNPDWVDDLRRVPARTC